MQVVVTGGEGRMADSLSGHCRYRYVKRGGGVDVEYAAGGADTALVVGDPGGGYDDVLYRDPDIFVDGYRVAARLGVIVRPFAFTTGADWL